MNTATHEPVITEDRDGFHHIACTCGWTCGHPHPRLSVAHYHHNDHVDEMEADHA